MLEALRLRIARAIAPQSAPVAPPRAVRNYHSAGVDRLTLGWSSSDASADQMLVGSLRKMRARSRQLVRDYAFAARAREIVQNNVIGAGIGFQAQVKMADGRLHTPINDAIEAAWDAWCSASACHTGGTLHFGDIERLALGEIFEAGEILLRIHRFPVGDSRVPIALEVIEPERLAEEYEAPDVGANLVRMGVEIDRFHRPVAYHIHEQHPHDLRWRQNGPDRIERVPAADIIHLYLVDRWPQTRGEPWMHATARRLWDMDGYTEAEIVAARASATYMGFIESPEADPLSSTAADGQQQLTLEAGVVEHLAPGEKFTGWNPGRPNPNMDPFLRYMLREVSAGVGVSYESLSRDYSQSNYSSSRLALLDDRDGWKVLQAWVIRNLRHRLHREWLQAAVYARAISTIRVEDYLANRGKYEAASWKPRGWSWVDPTKEVTAYKEAVKAGFCTVSDVVAATAGGRDLEDVLRDRRRELDMMAELGLEFDTVAAPAAPEPVVAPTDQEDPEDPASGEAARVLFMKGQSR